MLHLARDVRSRLPAILSRAGPLAAAWAEDGGPLEPGTIVVAPSDRHLIVRRGRCSVTRGPRENGLRPSIDVAFRSAALAYGHRSVAVVLSGTGDDGSAGVAAVSGAGGAVVVQDPDEATFPWMPRSAAARNDPQVLPLAEIAATVAAIVRERVEQGSYLGENVDEEMRLELEYASLSPEAMESFVPVGAPEERAQELEHALRVALWALHERARLAERVARRAHGHARERSARRFDELAREARDQAAVIRRALSSGDDRRG